MRPSALTAITIAAAAFLTACASPTTPTPTYSCTSEQGGSATPCSANEHEQAQQRDATYKQAEAVFRRYWAELGRLAHVTHPTFTEVMEETTSGAFEADVRAMLSPEKHLMLIEGEVSLVRISSAPNHARFGSTAALLVCVDARAARFRDSTNGPPSSGITYEMRVYLAPTAGVLKLIYGESRDVESC